MNALRLSLPAAACLLLAGCQISHRNHGDGDSVRVGTPFGSMHIKTDKDADIAGIGLATYPGSVPVKEHDGNHNDAADINLNFGDFHLGVKAASFQTSDAPSKVETFYRRDMARYGPVLKCVGDQPVGQPTHTTQGLTCSDQQNKREFHIEDQSELRAGSPDHMHIVGIAAKDGGTRIGLVALDLPEHHNDSDSE